MTSRENLIYNLEFFDFIGALNKCFYIRSFFQRMVPVANKQIDETFLSRIFTNNIIDGENQ